MKADRRLLHSII